MIAEAPPPPLQMLAIPNYPLFLFKTFIKLIITLEPLIPIGCPRATAPPCKLTFDGSKSNNFMFARATAAKASLISWKSISLICMPTFFKSLSHAFAGAIAKSIG